MGYINADRAKVLINNQPVKGEIYNELTNDRHLVLICYYIDPLDAFEHQQTAADVGKEFQIEIVYGETHNFFEIMKLRRVSVISKVNSLVLIKMIFTL